MKEVFKVGYTTYLEKAKKKNNWTSKIFEKIAEHKLMVTIFGVIFACVCINFWLIYKFMNILEMSRLGLG